MKDRLFDKVLISEIADKKVEMLSIVRKRAGFFWRKSDIDREIIWINFFQKILKDFDLTDRLVIFVSPIHVVRGAFKSVNEELESLSKRFINLRGNINGADYIFIVIEYDMFFEDIVSHYYDQFFKVFISKKPINNSEDLKILFPKVFTEEGYYSLSHHQLIVEIFFPAGLQCLITSHKGVSL